MDITAQNAALASLHGASRSAGAPATLEVHLFAGHPATGGTQLTTGYTVPVLDNGATGWPDAPSGGYHTAELVDYSFTADLTLPATHWRFKDPVSGAWWEWGELEVEWYGGAGTSDSFQPKVFFSQGVVA